MTELEIRAFRLQGEAYLRLGRLADAVEYLLLAESKEHLCHCGERALAQLDIALAQKAFAGAGLELDSARYLRAGMAALKKGQFNEAIELYKAAGAKTHLFACGTEAVKAGRVADAVRSFSEAGAALPAPLFIAAAKKALSEKDYGHALNLLLELKDKAELSALGNILLEQGQIGNGLTAFQMAGDIEGLGACIRRLLRQGNLVLPKEVFELGVLPAKEDLVECGSKLLAHGQFHSAKEAYEAAGTELPADQILVCAEKALENGRYREAMDAYQEAGVKPSKDHLVHCGEQLLKHCWFDEAVECFAAAEHAPGLIDCGDAALVRGRLETAAAAYMTAKHKDGLIACASRIASRGEARDFEKACELLYAAGDKEGLLKLGEAAIIARERRIPGEIFMAAARLEMC